MVIEGLLVVFVLTYIPNRELLLEPLLYHSRDLELIALGQRHPKYVLPHLDELREGIVLRQF